MQRTRHPSWIMGLWPGLSGLWHAGSLPGLGAAVAFTALLNTLLLESFVRSGTPGGDWNRYGWIILGAFWGLGLWRAARHPVSASNSSGAHHQQDLLIQAQGEYLKGHWVEAQTVLEQLIHANPRDVEAHLLLSSVFRRSRRIELSRKQLRRLYELDEAARWRFEIEREFALLDQTAEGGEPPSSGA
ncbi:MAG: tetratricopeptide repeat protein [Planctomycetota bacterium]